MKSLFLSLVLMSSAFLIGQKSAPQAQIPEGSQPTELGMLDYRPQPGRSYTLEFPESSLPRNCSYSAAEQYFTLNLAALSSTLLCRGKPERIQIIRKEELPTSPRETRQLLKRKGFQPLPGGTAGFIDDCLQVYRKQESPSQHSQLCFLVRDTASQNQWLITLTGDLQFKTYFNEA